MGLGLNGVSLKRDTTVAISVTPLWPREGDIVGMKTLVEAWREWIWIHVRHSGHDCQSFHHLLWSSSYGWDSSPSRPSMSREGEGGMEEGCLGIGEKRLGGETGWEWVCQGRMGVGRRVSLEG